MADEQVVRVPLSRPPEGSPARRRAGGLHDVLQQSCPGRSERNLNPSSHHGLVQISGSVQVSGPVQVSGSVSVQGSVAVSGSVPCPASHGRHRPGTAVVSVGPASALGPVVGRHVATMLGPLSSRWSPGSPSRLVSAPCRSAAPGCLGGAWRQRQPGSLATVVRPLRRPRATADVWLAGQPSHIQTIAPSWDQSSPFPGSASRRRTARHLVTQLDRRVSWFPAPVSAASVHRPPGHHRTTAVLRSAPPPDHLGWRIQSTTAFPVVGTGRTAARYYSVSVTAP